MMRALCLYRTTGEFNETRTRSVFTFCFVHLCPCSVRKLLLLITENRWFVAKEDWAVAMASKRSSLVFCFAFIAITSNGASFVCASINATISVTIEPTEGSLNFTKTIIHSGDFVFNVSSRASFFVIQAHSLTAGLVLSDDQNFGNTSTAAGASVGLVQMVNTTTDVYTFYLAGPKATNALISIQGYNDKAPIPGGCNMVLNPRDAPYQTLGITNEMIAVSMQPAAQPGSLCEDGHVKLEMYHYYIRSGYDKEAGYYDSVANMMTVNGIMLYGKKVGESTTVSDLRRYYNNYRGMGVVFGVIARYGNSSSAYVPAATFGCNLGETTCNVYIYSPLIVILLVLGFIAGFYKKYTTLCSNMIVLAIAIVYIMATQIPVDPSYVALPVLGFFAIVFYGVRRFKLNRFVNALVVGYLLSDLMLFGYFSDTDSFKNDYWYWTGIHTAMVTIITISVFPFRKVTSLFTSYIYLLTGFSMFFGGMFYYIFIFDFRRTFVPNFHLATLDLPSLGVDTLAKISAGLLSLCIFYFQCPCIKSNSDDAERTPLLA